MKILTINPGSTSTKIAVYENTAPMLTVTIRHTPEDLKQFTAVEEQFGFRRDLVLETLAKRNMPLDFKCIVARGGLTKPIEGGVYEVNELMLHDLEHAEHRHACNLGARIGYEIAKHVEVHCPVYIADPGVVDELEDVARITGSPIMPQHPIWHALNQRAIARRHAKENHSKYELLDLIVVHLGGGISVGAHRHGRCIDVNNALDGAGPFSPERAGTLPAGALIDLCYSNKYTCAQLKKRISGNAGIAAHLGTTDMIAIEDSIAAGNKEAELIVNSMIYQIAKEIGAKAVALDGRIDAILLTGGLANSRYIVSRLRQRVDFLGPVYVYPGEDEMLALAQNGLAVLRGEIPVKQYV